MNDMNEWTTYTWKEQMVNEDDLAPIYMDDRRLACSFVFQNPNQTDKACFNIFIYAIVIIDPFEHTSKSNEA